MTHKKLYAFFFGTLRGRLILSVALVHAVMMMLFVFDLTRRQRAMLLERQELDARSLSQALAVTSAGWLESDDVAGLQELVDANRGYPELLFAMLAEKNGRILAHTDKARVGQYLRDLPATPRPTLMSRSADLVDVSVPVLLNGRHVGWSRVGMEQKVTGTALTEITRNGILYTLLAILLGAGIAWVMGRRITRRLYAVQATINAVMGGDSSARSRIAGSDEAALLAGEFDDMLDVLSVRDAELRKSEEAFKRLFNAASIPLCFVDANGVLAGINDRFTQTFGYTRDDIPTQGEWFQRAYPDAGYRGEVSAAWEAAVRRSPDAHGDIAPMECRVTCKDGGGRTVIVSGTVFDDMVLAVYFDITERTRAEASLRNLTRLYALLSQINQAIVRTREPDELFAAICRVAVDYGRFRMAWIGIADTASATIVPVAHAGHEEGYLDHLLVSTEDNEAGNGPTGLAFRHAGVRICSNIESDPSMAPWKSEALKRGYRSSGAVAFTRRGAVFGTFSLYASEADFFTKEEVTLLGEIGDDISFSLDYMAADAERRRAEQETLAAKERAEQSDRLKDAFIANISHEIRTPLNIILGFARIIEEKYRPLAAEDQQHFFEALERGGERLQRTVDMILNISRLQAGVFAIHPEELDIGALIRRIVADHLPFAAQKCLTLEYIEDCGGARLVADEYCITQALCNLLSNAIKFTRKGIVSLRLFRDSEGRLSIEVQDTGAGISQEYLPKLFSRYSQEETGYSRSYEGLGLGLALVKEYLGLNNATIAVESEKGVGTTFTITFHDESAHVVDAPADEELVHPEPVGSDAKLAEASDTPYSVLLVEDDEMTIEFMNFVLDGKWRVHSARSVEEAWDVLRSAHIDVILMDISLAGPQTGLELTQEIRQNPAYRIIPIIAVTAHAYASDRANCLDAGCDDFIRKPVDKTVVVRTMERLLAK